MSKDKKTIYLVTVLHFDKKDQRENYKTRTVGFYFEESLAKQGVKENWGHISSCFYNYCVIEKQSEGFYNYVDPNESLWFNWDDEKWNECGRPEFTEGVCNWGIG